MCLLCRLEEPVALKEWRKYELSLIPQSALFRGLNFLLLHKRRFSCSADIKTQKGHLEKFGAKMVWKQVVLTFLSELILLWLFYVSKNGTDNGVWTDAGLCVNKDRFINCFFFIYQQ